MYLSLLLPAPARSTRNKDVILYMCLQQHPALFLHSNTDLGNDSVFSSICLGKKRHFDKISFSSGCRTMVWQISELINVLLIAKGHYKIVPWHGIDNHCHLFFFPAALLPPLCLPHREIRKERKKPCESRGTGIFSPAPAVLEPTGSVGANSLCCFDDSRILISHLIPAWQKCTAEVGMACRLTEGASETLRLFPPREGLLSESWSRRTSTTTSDQ